MIQRFQCYNFIKFIQNLPQPVGGKHGLVEAAAGLTCSQWPEVARGRLPFNHLYSVLCISALLSCTVLHTLFSNTVICTLTTANVLFLVMFHRPGAYCHSMSGTCHRSSALPTAKVVTGSTTILGVFFLNYEPVCAVNALIKQGNIGDT